LSREERGGGLSGQEVGKRRGKNKMQNEILGSLPEMKKRK